MKVQDAISTLYKSYILKSVAKDASRLMRRNFRNIHMNRDYWLHRMGLSTHRPVKNVLGGLGLFVLGAAAGGLTALALAPKKGTELRAQVRDKAMGMMGKAPATRFAAQQPQA